MLHSMNLCLLHVSASKTRPKATYAPRISITESAVKRQQQEQLQRCACLLCFLFALLCSHPCKSSAVLPATHAPLGTCHVRATRYGSAVTVVHCCTDMCSGTRLPCLPHAAVPAVDAQPWWGPGKLQTPGGAFRIRLYANARYARSMTSVKVNQATILYVGTREVRLNSSCMSWHEISNLI
jgi:hypothetical protein